MAEVGLTSLALIAALTGSPASAETEEITSAGATEGFLVDEKTGQPIDDIEGICVDGKTTSVIARVAATHEVTVHLIDEAQDNKRVTEFGLGPEVIDTYEVSWKEHIGENLTSSSLRHILIFEDSGNVVPGKLKHINYLCGEGGPNRPVPVDTIAGKDRYETALKVSKKHFKEAETVVLATGDDYPDALVGSVLAAVKGGPLLLTRSGRLNEEVAAEIKRLGAKNVILLGGSKALSPDIEKALSSIGLATKRLAGDSRFGTAEAIAKEIIANLPEGALNEVALTNGHNFADAVAISEMAARSGAPILLTRPDSLPSETERVLIEHQIQLERLTVAGGNLAVAQSVEVRAAAAAKAVSTRLSGPTRYATSIEVAKESVKRQDGNMVVMYVATGNAFPDALGTGAAAATVEGGALILVNGQRTDQLKDFEEFMRAHKKTSLIKIVFIGGENAISSAVKTEISSIVDSTPDNKPRPASVSLAPENWALLSKDAYRSRHQERRHAPKKPGPRNKRPPAQTERSSPRGLRIAAKR
jgi:putative cell wall-binding protein